MGRVLACPRGHESIVSNDVLVSYWRCSYCGGPAVKHRPTNFMDRRRIEARLLNVGIQRRLIDE